MRTDGLLCGVALDRCEVTSKAFFLAPSSMYLALAGVTEATVGLEATRICLTYGVGGAM